MPSLAQPSATPDTALPGSPSDNMQIRVCLHVVHNAFQLQRKSAKRAVPPGRVYVLQSAAGLLDAYRSGEVVSKSPLWEKSWCWVIELAEFPGKISLGVTKFLAAISRSEDDVALLNASFNVRLQSPLTLLKRLSNKWENEQGRDAFDKEVSKDIEKRIESLLSSGNIQVWSGDEPQVFERIFAPLDEELRMFGMCLDTTIHATETPLLALRRHPASLYNIALQFALAERTIRCLMATGWKDLDAQTGLSSRDLNSINATSEEEGIAFLFATRQNQQESSKIATWLRGQNAREAAEFVDNLYSGQFSAQEVVLSEQIVLAAIRNPMLTIGEWLRESAGATYPTLFHRLRDRVTALSK